ncbi:uncharacterized protein [Triticum aestivum]|uniref:uncharacterized protein isoform X8 n=1 Tax=Triticum aestivum TaxID=4565 RepID=UPI001D02395E|nr:uncharacterized protein LOC123061340 isoform X8 [Triticum aestivum]
MSPALEIDGRNRPLMVFKDGFSSWQYWYVRDAEQFGPWNSSTRFRTALAEERKPCAKEKQNSRCFLRSPYRRSVQGGRDIDCIEQWVWP